MKNSGFTDKWNDPVYQEDVLRLPSGTLVWVSYSIDLKEWILLGFRSRENYGRLSSFANVAKKLTKKEVNLLRNGVDSK